MQLFAEHGLHGVTTHDIARGAEVAAGTFYLHFKDKRELFREIAEQAVADLEARLEADCAPFGGPSDVREYVVAQTRALVGFAEENRAVIGMLFSGESDAAAVESDVLDRLAASVALERREQREAGRAGVHLDPGVLGQAVVGMWSRVLAWWCEDPTRASREELVETLTRIQLSGMYLDPKTHRADAGDERTHDR